MESLLDGARIARLRKQKGWDQYELAAAAHVTPSVVSRLERNLQADFRLSVVAVIAAALDVPVDSLLKREETVRTDELVVDLQVAVAQLKRQPEEVQRHAAGIIRGYLSSFEGSKER